MDRIKILIEKPSTRCEICHQSDLFIPQENICHRCSSIQLVKSENNSITRSTIDNDYGQIIVEVIFSRLNTGIAILFNLILIITITNYFIRYIIGNSAILAIIVPIVILGLIVILVNGFNQLIKPAKLLICTNKGIIYNQTDKTTFIPWKRIKNISFEKDETETLVLHIHYDEKYPISGVGKYSDTYYINISASKGFRPSGQNLFEIINKIYKSNN